MLLYDPDNATDFMYGKASGACNAQRLKPKLGIVAAPTFAFAYMHMRRFAQVSQNKVESVALFTMNNRTHVPSPLRAYYNRGCFAPFSNPYSSATKYSGRFFTSS